MAELDYLGLAILRQVCDRDGTDLAVVIRSLGGYDGQINDRVRDLLKDGYLVADETLPGDNTVMAAKGLRCTAKGSAALTATLKAKEPAMPATVEEAWQGLFAALEPFSKFEHEAKAAQGDLMNRGAYSSGQSIYEATRVAFGAGLRWDPKGRRFRKPLLDRLRSMLIVVAGTLATLLPLLFRSGGTSLGEAVSSAATVAAVFVALYAVARERQD